MKLFISTIAAMGVVRFALSMSAHGPKTRPKDFSGPDVLSIKAVRRPDQKPSSVDGIQTIPEIR